MDWVNCSSKAMEVIKKYRYVLLVIAAGILLVRLPESTHQEQSSESPELCTAQPQSLDASLSGILCLIEGAGRVEVLLTQAEGEEILYQTDSRQSSGQYTQDVQRDTVLVTGDDREETGLIRQRNPPVYQGAIILCQGADNAQIRLSIVKAVMGVTGLTSDKITVLKMK